MCGRIRAVRSGGQEPKIYGSNLPHPSKRSLGGAPGQFPVTSHPCLAVDVLGQQLIGPQFLGITQIFWLLARQILYPCNGFVRNLARLARPRQLSQCRLQSKAKVFSNAKDHGISIHLTGRSIRLIHHAIGRIQQTSRTHRPPLLFRPRSTDRFEAGTILGRQYETRTLPAIGHAPLKHSCYKMYSYLENDNLVVAGSGSQPLTSNRWGDYSSMRIDQDGCTFWYTQEYYMTTQKFDWSTQIASAKFSNCK